jgi:hypothetical protein
VVYTRFLFRLLARQKPFTTHIIRTTHTAASSQQQLRLCRLRHSSSFDFAAFGANGSSKQQTATTAEIYLYGDCDDYDDDDDDDNDNGV